MHVCENVVQADVILVSIIFLFIVIDGIAKLSVKILELASIVALEVLTEVVLRVLIFHALAHS